ncbi:MOSC domain-containing protein [Nocardioides sp. JQ2195]|uniref:MOSC domain-containing protein n=1 Tax=Nocardioides sp. JQ2195 TaxID=2592334 RepID=UPI00143E14AF|nr:MOSC domain-containing protein [Nocardioides sp. JQ2195]QIX27364.1 MOSC domain-containing protein [Nocardioides sp. JQ2195]
MTASVLQISIGLPRDEEWAGNLKRTAIDKKAVAGPVDVRRHGIDGDQVADTVHHGGPDMAVYAFAREDLDRWERELDGPIRNGFFGENLTTQGIDVNEALVGERWRIGEVLLEVAKVRIPCSVFKNWMGLGGFDDVAWVKRFAADQRPGPYLRVLEEGRMAAGDEIVVEHRPDHGITVSHMFRALTTERQLAPGLLAVEGLAASVRARITRT